MLQYFNLFQHLYLNTSQNLTSKNWNIWRISFKNAHNIPQIQSKHLHTELHTIKVVLDNIQ